MRSRLGPALAAPALALLAALVPMDRPLAAVTWDLDPSRSELVLRIYKAGIGKALAHDHVVRATEATGTIVFDPGGKGPASVVISVDARSLRADEPAVRERYGLGGMGEKDRREVQKTMEGAGQLDVERYPEIRFESTSVESRGDGKLAVTGRLTLHGRTKAVSFPATVSLDGETLRGEASLRFAQSSFGIEPYSAAFGAVKNQDEVELLVRLAGQRR